MLASRASWAAGSGRRTAIVRVNLNHDRAAPAQHGPRLGRLPMVLGPAERLLSALLVALADRITQVASCEHRGPVGCVYAICGVTLRSRRSSTNSRSMVPIAEPSSASTTSPYRFSSARCRGRRAWPHCLPFITMNPCLPGWWSTRAYRCYGSSYGTHVRRCDGPLAGAEAGPAISHPR